MRYILAIILFITITSFKNEEEFYVTYISKPGAVRLASNNLPVKVGDKLTFSIRLYFERNSKITGVNPDRGRFEYDGTGVLGKTKKGFIARLRDMIGEPEKYGSFLVRSSDFRGYDPKTYFNSNSTDGSILFIDGVNIPLSSYYNDHVNSFFFIQFEDMGKTIVRKVQQNKGSLIFNQQIFSSANGKSITGVYLLCRQFKESGKSRSETIATFKPVFADKETIIEQINVFKIHSGLKDKDSLNNMILSHLYSNYGKVGIEIIDELFK